MSWAQGARLRQDGIACRGHGRSGVGSLNNRKFIRSVVISRRVCPDVLRTLGWDHSGPDGNGWRGRAHLGLPLPKELVEAAIEHRAPDL
jgi:hypothetical protein